MLRCMPKRTTLALDDDLFRSLKERAARERTTLARLVNGLLRLATRRRRPAGYRFHLTVHRGGRLMPGVVLEDREKLFDLMDGR